MEAPGQPFEAAASAAAPTTTGAPAVADPPFPPDDYEPMVIPSSQLAENARKSRGQRQREAQEAAASETASAPSAETPGTEAAPTAGAPVAEGADAAPEAAEAGTADPPAAGAREELAAPVGSSWPVRLVSSLPDTQPPRAILGLPDGREVVVTAGSMIPDQGIVVMAIGQERVQLARISASGDHAVIKEESINAQY
jgi:type IV secretory pathway VirB10-like protein